MVAAGGVDHRVGLPGLFGQHRTVIQGADDRGDAQGRHLGGLLGAAHQARHMVAGLDQAGGDGAADKSGGAGNEYVHGGLS